MPDVNQSDAVSLKNHRELVKKFVFENGSVATNIFWNENYLDKSGKNYYYNSYASATNHTAAIIGWDDLCLLVWMLLMAGFSFVYGQVRVLEAELFAVGS